MNYIGIFNSIGRFGFGRLYLDEPLYVVLNLVVHFFTDNPVGLAVGVNLVIFIPLYWYINRYVEDQYKFLIIYIFMLNPYMYIQSTFNMLRQGCATGILLLSIPYFIEKKWLKFILIVLIAAQFHNISYVFLLLVGVRLIPWNRWLIGGTLAVSCILNLIMRNNNFLARMVNVFGYEGYLDYRDSMLNLGVYVLFVFLIVVLFLLYYDKLYKNEKEKAMIDLYLVSLSLLPIFVKNAQMYRVYVMLAFMSLPAVPYIVNSFSLQKGKREYVLVKGGYYIYYFFFISLFLARMYMTGNRCYVPFEFFWHI